MTAEVKNAVKRLPRTKSSEKKEQKKSPRHEEDSIFNIVNQELDGATQHLPQTHASEKELSGVRFDKIFGKRNEFEPFGRHIRKGMEFGNESRNVTVESRVRTEEVEVGDKKRNT